MTFSMMLLNSRRLAVVAVIIAAWLGNHHGATSFQLMPVTTTWSRTSTASFPRSRTTTTSIASSLAVDEDAAKPSTNLHLHEFWGQERSSFEIKSHIQDCLHDIEDNNRDDGSSNMEPQEQRVSVVSAEPPLVLIHDFLSTSMCKAIVQSAQDSPDMRRSTTGKQQETSSTRTSSTVWLREHECEQPLRLLAEKVSSISGLPASHMENLQVARYRPGQEFRVHTDHQDSFNGMECGGRLATCIIYLSEPTEGGETWFPGLQNEATIPPRRGSAVFFWNTHEKPGSQDYQAEMFLHADERMRHAGLAVEKGEKWICNRWVHPMDFGAGVRGTTTTTSASTATPVLFESASC